MSPITQDDIFSIGDFMSPLILKFGSSKIAEMTKRKVAYFRLEISCRHSFWNLASRRLRKCPNARWHIFDWRFHVATHTEIWLAEDCGNAQTRDSIFSFGDFMSPPTRICGIYLCKIIDYIAYLNYCHISE